MINDYFLRLSENQAPVSSAGTANTYPVANMGTQAFSANYIDLLQNRDIGDGGDMEVQLTCTEALTSTQIWSAQVTLGATPYSVASSALPVANLGFLLGASAGTYPGFKLAVGDRIIASISPLTLSLGLRYLYVVFTNHAGATATAGKFTIDICHTTQTSSGSLSYPVGYTVT
jgi:hypothetical protein